MEEEGERAGEGRKKERGIVRERSGKRKGMKGRERERRREFHEEGGRGWLRKREIEVCEED